MSGSAVARLVRRVFDRGNPLARGSDRLEVLLLVLAVVVSLIGLPFAATVRAAVYESRSVERREEVATRHPARAVLLVDAPPLTGTVDQAGGVRVSAVPASWRLPDGSMRTGEVAAAHGTKAGSAVRVWLDEEGVATEPPPAPVSATVGAAVIALALWAALVGLVTALCAAVRWVNTRTSLRKWAAEWAAVGPEWTR